MAEIMMVMDAAKKIMRQSGNMYQWGDGYPSEAVITADMEKKGGFVVVDDGMVVGYFAFLQSPEPTYAKIYDGEWIDDVQPYHVVHRIASYPDAHGIFSSIMDFCFSHDRNIRIDTHRDNKIMQHKGGTARLSVSWRVPPEARLHLLRHHLSAVWRRKICLSKDGQLAES